MKNLYSKSLMAAVAVMMLASCSNEEPNVNPQGKEQKVTIGMSVKGVGTKSTANGVNLGTDMQDINNIVVVPMIGAAFQNPILFGTLDVSERKVQKETRTMSQNVNRFKVYGNVLDGYVNHTYSNLSETTLFPGLSFTAPEWADGTQPKGGTYSKPHALYYYFDTKRDGGYYAAKNDSWDAVNWRSLSPISGDNSIGENNCIKIGSVNYEVGVLAAAVKNGDNTTDFYSDAECKGPSTKWTGSEITVSGIIVYDQTQTFDADFTGSGSVNVFETDALPTLSTADVTSSDRDGGNLYCVVTETDAETVTLNIEFTVAEGKYFKLADGNTIVGGENNKLYLPVVLNKELASVSGNSATKIFEKDFATFLNATVKNWGLASETPVETTDVTIGVEFDVDWAAGLQFDVEI